MRLLCSVFLAAVCTVSFAGSAAAQKRPGTDDADTAEVKSFRLDMNRLNKFGAATKSLMALPKERNELQKKMEDGASVKTIDGMVQSMNKYPSVVSAITGAGLTVREYSVMTMTLVTSAMAVGMKQQGLMKETPPTVSAENVSFVEQNFEKISEMMSSMQAGQQ